MLSQGVLLPTLHAAGTMPLAVIPIHASEQLELDVLTLPCMVAICCKLLKGHRLDTSACCCLFTG